MVAYLHMYAIYTNKAEIDIKIWSNEFIITEDTQFGKAKKFSNLL